MLAVLQFIFSSFWVWLGTVILLAIVVKGTTVLMLGFAAVIRPPRAPSRLPGMDYIKPGSTGPKPSY